MSLIYNTNSYVAAPSLGDLICLIAKLIPVRIVKYTLYIYSFSNMPLINYLYMLLIPWLNSFEWARLFKKPLN